MLNQSFVQVSAWYKVEVYLDISLTLLANDASIPNFEKKCSTEKISWLFLLKAGLLGLVIYYSCSSKICNIKNLQDRKK